MHVKLFRVTCTTLNNTISAQDAKGMKHNLFLIEHFITKIRDSLCFIYFRSTSLSNNKCKNKLQKANFKQEKNLKAQILFLDLAVQGFYVKTKKWLNATLVILKANL